MRKSILEKKLSRLTAKRSELKARALASNDANEVRAINEQLEDLNCEIEETTEEISALEAEEARGAEPFAPPANAQLVNGNLLGSFNQNGPTRAEDPTASVEYRSAFMAYVQRGTPIPVNLRSEAISTDDTGVLIPVTVMTEVINEVNKSFGSLYSKVRKLSVPGGVEIPVASLKAQFKWINEGTASPRQKLDALGSIKFAYHTAEIRIAQTFLSSILTLNVFEKEISKVIAEAYLENMDISIIRGTGKGMPLGILNDLRITNEITMTAAELSDWKKWRQKFFAKLPLKKRNGEFIFPVSTIESYLETMSDSNNNPVFKQATDLTISDGDNYGGSFYGRALDPVEPELIPDFDNANAGDVIGIYWQPNEYGINENFGFSMRRYFDEETNEHVNKALTVTDGMTLDPSGFWLIKKA